MELTRYQRKEDVNHKWFVVDAAGATLGRLAVKIADTLRGANKANYTPITDVGDYVVVINADKIVLTGLKWEQKKYYSYSGYQSGLTMRNARDMQERHPDHLIRHAVKGMLPKNKLASQVIGKLKIYAGAEHPHQAQNVEKLEF